MGADSGVVPVRERVWVTMVDKEQDPPRPVREIFIENGVVQRDGEPEEAEQDEQQ